MGLPPGVGLPPGEGVPPGELPPPPVVPPPAVKLPPELLPPEPPPVGGVTVPGVAPAVLTWFRGLKGFLDSNESRSDGRSRTARLTSGLPAAPSASSGLGRPSAPAAEAGAAGAAGTGSLDLSMNSGESDQDDHEQPGHRQQPAPLEVAQDALRVCGN